MKNFFTITLSGLSEPDTRKVLQVLESPKFSRWSLSEGANGDLLVIDVDSVWGHMDWLRAVAEGRRCAAYTQEESMRDCELLLHKPLDSAALSEILLKVQGGTETAADEAAASGNGKAVSPAATPPRAAQPAPAPAPRPAPAAQAVPAAANQASRPAAPAAKPASENKPAPAAKPREDAPSTIAAMLLGGGIDTPVVVRDSEGGTTLFIDPIKNIYRAPPQLKPLTRLMSMSSAKMLPIDANDPKMHHAGPEQPIVRLLWFAALCASNGKLNSYLSRSSSWKLTRWPQIEREFPRHFRIATAMMKQAGTIEAVAEAAKSPVEDVASFINAYYIAGYVAADGTEEPEDAANSTANVLSRLRRTFTRGTRAAAAS